MKIGLLFGSFNPVHIGHLIIAQHIANFYTDEVWFVVSPQNPLKNSDSLLNVNNRMQLVKAAIKTNKKFRICELEISLQIPSYTIDTLEVLDIKYPKYEFYLIMGSDNFISISNWKSSERLLKDYKIVIYQRPEFSLNPQNLTSANILTAKAPLINISATEIRKLISAKKSIQYLVPQSVISLIEENQFYYK